MFIFIFGVVLGAVPQYLKLILLASSEGISLVSLALMNVSNLTATLNIFILHFEQIKQCIKQSVPEYSFDACQASLLTFYYTLVYTLLWFPLYPLAAHFCRLVYFYLHFRIFPLYGQSNRLTSCFCFVYSNRKSEASTRVAGPRGAPHTVRHISRARAEDGAVVLRVLRVRSLRASVGCGQRGLRGYSVSLFYYCDMGN